MNWRSLDKFKNLKECELPGIRADERFRRWILEDILLWGQRPYSYVSLHMLALTTNPKTIVELGTGLGGSTACLVAAARKTGGKVYTVDKNGPEEENNAYTRDLLALDVEDGYLEFIKGDSIETGLNWKGGVVAVDFLFHDAIHDGEGVYMELEAWHPHTHSKTIHTVHDTWWREENKPSDIYEYCLKFAQNYGKTCYHLDTHAGMALIVPRR